MLTLKDITSAVKTTQPVIPMVYAYTTPNDHTHDGWTKIGYTEKKTVEDRIKEQSHTTDTLCKLEWKGTAIYDDGSGDIFSDHDFHGYLVKNGVERKRGTEWFKVVARPDAQAYFFDFKQNRGLIIGGATAIPYVLREEQNEAVSKTVEYYDSHPKGEFLWNAKPRFGKTLSVYDFCLRVKAQKVLILTNRPAIADSWYNDYVQFVGQESGYYFVSHVDAIKDKKYCMTRDEFVKIMFSLPPGTSKCIEFVSLQDLKGSDNFGGNYNKLNEVAQLEWDVLVLDEAHEGVDTEKTDIALDHIKRRFTLNLSGTPFKMLANDKFPEKAIFNWTYADEQARKREQKYADMGDESPYAFLPKLNMFTYQMSEIIGEKVDLGIDIDDDTYAYFFDLNEFFKTKTDGTFVHDEDVDKFLDAMTQQTKYPFSTEDLRNQLKHTMWLLDRIDSAKALKEKLQKHFVFKEYAIVLAAGSGDDDFANKTALANVREAIEKYDKTITLTVGQLTTGVTIPEWSAVMMLCNCKSPSLYMQAAFRAQNPCLFTESGKSYRKENAYVFDFDPARTLDIFEQFANNLSPDTAGDKGDSDTRKQHVRELLNFFPVIGEDDNGEMIELDAEKVLSIPRRIHAKEVVRSGFMSNFLFQNIGNIFGAPKAVTDILSKMSKADPFSVPEGTADKLNLDEDGNVDIPEQQIIGTATEKFGNPVFGDVLDQFDQGVKKAMDQVVETEEDRRIAEVRKNMDRDVVKPIVERIKDAYGKDVSPAQKKTIERVVRGKCEKELNRVIGDRNIRRKQIEKQFAEEIATADSHDQQKAIEVKYDDLKKALDDSFQEEITYAIRKSIDESAKDTVKTIEKAVREREKKTMEDDIREHLRGFARTIPSFLMAYGDKGVTLASFDTVIPDSVFLEVTSITTEEFRKLRDGFDYEDEETHETKHYPGHLFDEVVFNDSVTEFMNKRRSLADYFDENQTEDIFDYVPPQRTNQIFTPKRVVKMMVDLYEEQNPGCFDDPNNTFADLYMKSGLYITEIVKRLYRSEEIKKEFPNDQKRLDHILDHQVYGAAPSEIIYMIAMHFIFGFDDTIDGISADDLQELYPNFVLKDTAALAQKGELAAWAEKTFVKRKNKETAKVSDTKPPKAENPAVTKPVVKEADSVDLSWLKVGVRVIHGTRGAGVVTALKEDSKNGLMAEVKHDTGAVRQYAAKTAVKNNVLRPEK